ncbi:Pr6Pr family membrane protein [Microbacterium sp. NPDC055521]
MTSWWPWARLAVSLLGFAAIIGQLPQGSTVPWSNEVLHVVFPLFLLADVLVAPKRRILTWPTLAVIAASPLAWAAYTLVRANLATSPGTGDPYWYPYPFLNPQITPPLVHRLGGYPVPGVPRSSTSARRARGVRDV